MALVNRVVPLTFTIELLKHGYRKVVFLEVECNR